MESVVRKIAKEGCELEFFILRAEWFEFSISLTVIDNENAWSGKLEPDDLDSLCKLVKSEKEKYFSEVIRALVHGDDFTFTIENECFILKKVSLETNIKIRFCTISLSKTPVLPSLLSLVEKLLDNEDDHKVSIAKMCDELKILKQERQDLVKKLQNFIEEKSSLETMLYSKFCEVLNSKKQKLLLLEAQLSSLNCGQNSAILNQNLVIKQELQEGGEREKLPESTTTFSSSVEGDLRESTENSISFRDQSENRTTEINKHSDHYDSETDIDTDYECSDDGRISPVHEKVTLTSTDTSVTKKRILPKRGCNSSIQSVKRQCTMVESTTCENEEVEFNSQSLLEEY